MIVRIATEGQYELADGDARRGSTRSTTTRSPPSRRATRRASPSCSARSSRSSASEGAPLAEDDLHGSDVIVPPPDTSFEEARHEFSGDGLIPD